MIIKNQIFILFIFFLIFFVNKNQAQNGLNTTEYNCCVNVMNKISTNKAPINSTNGYYQFGSLLSGSITNPVWVLSTSKGGVWLVDFEQNTNTSLTYSDLTCFTVLYDLDYDYPPGSSVNSLLTYTYQKAFTYFQLKIKDPAGMTLKGPVGTNFKTIRIYLQVQPNDLYINFSWINTTTNFYLSSNGYPANSTSFKIYFNNDLVNSSKLWSPSMSIYSQNFPSFNYIKGSISVYLNYGFDKNSLAQNISTIQNLSSIYIYGKNEVLAFPSNITKVKSNSLNTVFFQNLQFNTPTQMINLTDLGILYSFGVYGVGRQFHYNKNMPFIFGKKPFYSFTFSDAYIETIDLSYYFKNFQFLQSLTLSNNSMSGDLGLFNQSSQVLDLDLSYNQITGTIDESFCRLNYLYVSNNSLTGTIPSCFTCWFSQETLLQENFRGNQFTTDIDNPPPCNTISPNLVKVNSSDVYEECYDQYLIFGSDLGGSFADPTIEYDANYPNFYANMFQIVIPNQLFSFQVYNGCYDSNPENYQMPKTINLTYYNYYERVFTLATEPTNPQINQVSWYGNDLVFNGSYFTYNVSIVSISVTGVNCMVSGSTFYQINCTLTKSISTTNNIALVKVGDLISQVTLSGNKINTIKNCSSFGDCNYTDGNGYCNTEIGSCSCSTNWTNSNCSQCSYNYQGTKCDKCASNYQGSDCLTPFVQCPIVNSKICSGSGTCNNQTGICTCDFSHQSLNCSIPYKQCPVDTDTTVCFGHGTCNNQTGVCTCSSNYQSSDCSKPFIACPIANSKTCSGSGTCNNQTGICTCSSNSQGSDCSIPYRQCPIDADATVCFGHGTCNNQTGVCTCSSNYQSSDCSKPYIACPVINTKTCSGSGTCNNQTGICTCSSNSQGSDCSTPFIQCPIVNSQICSGYGNCNNVTGTCKCDSSHQSFDCSKPYIPCPNDCSSLGKCNNQTGICQCNDRYSISPSCLPIECLDPTCGGHGLCNKSIGACECQVNPLSWTGINCTVPKQYVSSIDSSTTDGGNATFYGWFGDLHDTLSISIGSKSCSPITSVTSDSLSCNAQPGTGEQPLSITQNGFTYTSTYKYRILTFTCLNNCTGPLNGICNTANGYCTCYGNYGGPDCSFYKNNDDTPSNTGSSTNDHSSSSEPIVLPPSQTNVNQSTGSTNINNQKTNYQLSIYSLVEKDIGGNIITTTPLQNNWEINSSTDSIYKFTQSIQNGICTINYIIEEVKVIKNYSFADIEFKVDAGSIKMSVEILNYQYQNSLNTLQLLMKSSVDTIKTDNGNDDSCNDGSTEINTIGDDNSLNYITINKNNKILYGRFIDRLVSDGRSTYTTTTIIEKTNDTIIVAMNLPHFVNSLQLDPDFSVLISTNYKSSCPGESKKTWVLPVAVAVPVIGCCCIVGAIIYFLRKRSDTIFLNKFKSQFSSVN